MGWRFSSLSLGFGCQFSVFPVQAYTSGFVEDGIVAANKGVETMPVYICLLRGINVGGKRMKMAAVREMFGEIGIANAQTLLASGNIVFQSDESDRDSFVAPIEAAIQSTFGFESKVIMRSRDDLQAAIENNPFPVDERTVKGNRLLVTFLRSLPDAEAIEALNQWHTGVERIQLVGTELFVHYVDGAGNSKLTNNVIERKLNVVGTARNWNTVLKLQALGDRWNS